MSVPTIPNAGARTIAPGAPGLKLGMHRLLHFMSPSGHFVRHVASPRRSRSEIAGSCAFESATVVAAVIQSTNKNIAIL
jgi:hypothetical protein